MTEQISRYEIFVTGYLCFKKKAFDDRECACLETSAARLRLAADKHTPLTQKNKKMAREGAETPAEPLRRFPRFLSRALYVLYFFRYFLGRAFFRSLARTSSCGTFIFQVSLFLRPFLRTLQKNISKNLRISLLLTTGNDFVLFLHFSLLDLLFRQAMVA